MISIYINGYFVHRSSLEDETCIVQSPHLRIELNRPEVLTFTLPPKNKFFGTIQKRKDIVIVKDDNETIFYGQVIDERPNIDNMIEYTCEGMLSYLSDSIQRPLAITGDENLTAKAHFISLIENHNTQVESAKRFTIGIVDASEKVMQKENADYTNTLSAIEQRLVNRYGGYLRVRRENSVNYIDWLKELTDVCTQTVEFGENIIDIDGLIDTREVGSVLIPLGAKTGGKKLTIADVNGGLDYIESAELIEKYGRVVVTKEFPTIKDANELLEKAREALAEMEDNETFDITAVDLSRLGVDVSALRVGLLTPIRALEHGIDKNKILYAADMDLENIENSVYTFGLPRQTLTEALAETARGGGAAGKKIEELSDVVTDAYIEIDKLNGEILLRAYQDEMNTRFSEAWIDINGVKADLLLKADQETVEELSRTVTQAMIDIDGAKADILLKADKTYVEDLEKTVNQAQIDINGANAAILLKADTETVNALGEKVTEAMLAIDGQNALIEAKASVEYVDGKYSDAMLAIDGQNALIEAKASVDYVDGKHSDAMLAIDGQNALIEAKASVEYVDGKHTDAMLAIDGQNALIEAKASVEYVDGKHSDAMLAIDGQNALIEAKASVDYVDGKHTDAMLAIDGQNALIEAKASVEYVNGKHSEAMTVIDGQNALIEAKASKTYVDGKHSDAMAVIDGQNALIEAKASKTYVDGEVSEAMVAISGANSRITAQAQVIELKADQTYVDNLFAQSITAANLSANLSNLDAIVNDSIQGNLGDFETVQAQGVTIGAPGGLSVGGLNYSSHSHAVSVNEADGTVTLGEVSATGGNFRIADTQYYKNGVSAAKQSARESVKLVNTNGWQSGTFTVEAQNANGQTYVVSLPEFTTSVTGFNTQHKATVNFSTKSVNLPLESVEVDASSVYEQGLADGGDIEITLSESGWKKNINTVSAKSGDTVLGEIEIAPPALSSSIGQFEEDHTVNVKIFSEASIFPALDFDIDASSVYTEGANSVFLYQPDGWNEGHNTVRASNGRRVTVTLPDFTVSGGETFDSNHKTTVYFSTKSVDRPLKSVTVDASSVYEEGYAAGWAAAKAMIRHDQTDKRLFFGPGSTVDTEEQIYKITVAAELNGPRNSAPSIVTASATARVYLDGTQILYDIKNNDLTINSGML